MGFYIYPFTESLEGSVTRYCDDPHRGLSFADDELYHRVYVKDIASNKSTSSLFGTIKAARKKIRGAYITEIAGERVFDQHDAIAVLDRLHDQGVMDFCIKFAPEKKLDAKALKKAIDDYNLFESSTTTTLKGYRGDDDAPEQDDGSRRFSIGTKIYKEFCNYEYTGKVV